MSASQDGEIIWFTPQELDEARLKRDLDRASRGEPVGKWGTVHFDQPATIRTGRTPVRRGHS